MAANLQKSGSVSHAPREPSIKEDDDEQSESTAGNTTSSNSTLPIIGGHPSANHHHFAGSALHPGHEGETGGGSQLSPGGSSTERSVTPLGPQLGDSSSSATIGGVVRPFLHPSPSMPPQALKSINAGGDANDPAPKMSKSTTGQHIGGSHITSVTPTPPGALGPILSPLGATAAQQQQPPAGAHGNLASSAFPRGSRNRQTFHGKTDHNRVRIAFFLSPSALNTTIPGQQ